jgi:uncharacterized protein
MFGAQRNQNNEIEIRSASISVCGADFAADLSGALYWEDAQLLVVSDLHLEKGSSYAMRGVLLPPYDTAATLARLTDVIAHHNPRMVIALGDSFHDREAHERLSHEDSAAISALQAGRDWIWISGNHDPALPRDIGGVVADEIAIGPVVFRHEPTGALGEIAGHLHPKARVTGRGRTVERRCFAGDGERAIMPAFGAYAGGLNIRDTAFNAIFRALDFTAHVLGDNQVHAIAASRCY